MSVKIEKITYAPYGNSIKISNGIVELVVTVDVGPRVIRYGFPGKENIFLENSDMSVDFDGKSAWKIKGGHRFWHTPEDHPRNYVPDDDPVEWQEIENGVRVIQALEPWTQMRKEMDVVLSPDSTEVTVYHKLINKNAWPIECGIWGETACAPGGVSIAPQAKKDTGVVCNRVMSLWPYSDMTDKRIFWGKDYIFMSYDGSAELPFKYGISQDDGWGAYINNGMMFVKTYDPVDGGKYPDYGCSWEAYTNKFFLEVESLSPLYALAPGGYCEHTEKWQLFDNVAVPKNEEEVKNITALFK